MILASPREDSVPVLLKWEHKSGRIDVLPQGCWDAMLLMASLQQDWGLGTFGKGRCQWRQRKAELAVDEREQSWWGNWEPEQEALEEQVCTASTTFALSWMHDVQPNECGVVPRKIQLTLHRNSTLQLPNQTWLAPCQLQMGAEQPEPGEETCPEDTSTLQCRGETWAWWDRAELALGSFRDVRHCGVCGVCVPGL